MSLKRALALMLGVLLFVWIFHSNASSTAASVGSDVTTHAPSAPDADDDDESDKPERTFSQDVCTVDCSGHEAGYRWAEDKGISDESDCEEAADHSNSPSFGEGCKAYVNGDPEDEDKDEQ